MKNKFIALALVTLSIATTTVSCTKDDSPLASKAQVETTKVAFDVNAENVVSPTGKSTIDRGNTPLYVNEVTIWANSAYGNVLQSFDFGTSSATNPLPTGFFLNGVSLGSNTFGATSTGADVDQRLFIGDVPASATPSVNNDVLSIMKAHTPYIRCSADQVTQVITKSGNAKVSLNMKTDYGRILAKFVQESPNADDYIVTVQPTAMAWDDALSYVAPKLMPETVITPRTGFEWSNSDAMFIYGASFTIRIYENLGGVKGQLLNTITKDVQIAKSTTKLCTFTIHNTDVKTNIEANGIELKFPTIGEVEVPLN